LDRYHHIIVEDDFFALRDPFGNMDHIAAIHREEYQKVEVLA
jgi:hypothetical protein